MGTYILPFEERQTGWYEIEAESLEQAKALADNTDYIAELEPNYKDGYTDWNSDDVTELRAVDYVRQEN